MVQPETVYGDAEHEAGRANAQMEDRPWLLQAEVYGRRKEHEAQQ
jgi:hypothetical protein